MSYWMTQTLEERLYDEADLLLAAAPMYQKMPWFMENSSHGEG